MYATVEEANAHIQAYYGSTNPIRVAWGELSSGDRQVALNRAELSIDLLPLKGRPLVSGKAFPRLPCPDESIEAVKIATIELAIQGLDSISKNRLDLQEQGVKSYKIGDLSETFGDKASYSGVSNFDMQVVFPYLSKWLGGGYDICPTQIKRHCGRRVCP